MNNPSVKDFVDYMTGVVVCMGDGARENRGHRIFGQTRQMYIILMQSIQAEQQKTVHDQGKRRRTSILAPRRVKDEKSPSILTGSPNNLVY